MIPVALADEPGSFDATVRQPGLRAIAELVGQRPPRSAGPRFIEVADSRDAIPPGRFPPYWRHAIDDLLESYQRVCAYLCTYIPRGVGAPSVDHMVPKSMRWDQVYEWTNYRLACALMNARKSDVGQVLDPVDVQNGWFALELYEFQVVPGVRLPRGVEAKVTNTISRLRLNDSQCREARREYAVDYWGNLIAWVLPGAPCPICGKGIGPPTGAMSRLPAQHRVAGR